MKEKIKNYAGQLRAPTPFHFDCAGGGRYQKTLMVATNNFFSSYQGGQRVAGNMVPIFPFSVVLPYSVFLIHLKFHTTITCGFFFHIEKNKARTSALLFIWS